MERVLLVRAETSDQGTFGRLVARGRSFFTAELPWRDNRSNVSSIPAGSYSVAWTDSPRFKRKMFLVHPVKDRTGVRIHKANYAGDASKGLRCHLNGCIALGHRIGVLDGQKAVMLSAPAVREFEDMMAGKPFILEVRDGWA